MIYTVIAYTKDRDCRILRQPLSNFPKNISEYIEKAKNGSVREERIIAYSALFSALAELFGIADADIRRKKDGKPYLTDGSGTPLPYSINISHSDGVAAVTISDEGEIGVDIQGEIKKEVSERLESRYFKDICVKYSPLEVKYLILDGENTLKPLTEYTTSCTEEPSFCERWAFCEATLKCEGGGFFSIGRINELSKDARADIISVKIRDKNFYIATVKI